MWKTISMHLQRAAAVHTLLDSLQSCCPRFSVHGAQDSARRENAWQAPCGGCAARLCSSVKMARIADLSDDNIVLIGQFLLCSPRSVFVLAHLSKSLNELMLPTLAQLKSLLFICDRALGVTRVAQLARLGTLIFHSHGFSLGEINGLRLAISSDAMPALREICLDGCNMTDLHWDALTLAIHPGTDRSDAQHTGASKRLTMLSLTQQRFSGHVLVTLGGMIESGHFPRLRLLDLTGSIHGVVHPNVRAWRDWEASVDIVLDFRAAVERTNAARQQQRPPEAPLVVHPQLPSVGNDDD